MTDTVHVTIQVRVGLPEDGQFAALAPMFRRLVEEMDAEAAALALSASVAPRTEETE